MRLTKLEMQGFKSFAKKTELQFGNGITAVIGPNGSGKSNISDAIRWVLGEQSARALRGSKMEDVIFNGTQKRRPLGMAEVVLTFDNSDKTLPVEFSEVAVTRRVYRNGDSEYAINGKACRLKDVLELFRDTGIGKDGYSIISQGKVDEILSNKSSDRRTALEEAAGVMRYRVRRTEAERKLESTEDNMERIADILHELHGRLGPLHQQRDKALVYQQTKEELKTLEVNLFLHEMEKDQVKISDLKSALNAIQEKIDQTAAEDRVIQEAGRALEDEVRLLDEKMTQGQNRLLDLLSQVEGHQGEEKVLLARQESLHTEHERLCKETEDRQAEIKELQAALQRLSLFSTEEKGTLEVQIEEANQALCQLNQTCQTAEAALEEKKNRIMEELNRLSDKKSSISRLSAMEQAVIERMEASKGDADEGDARLQQLQAEKDSAVSLHNELLAQRDNLRETLAFARENNAALISKQEKALNDLHDAEQRSNTISSRLHVLEELARKREGYQNSVRLIMEQADRDIELKKRILGVVAELIHVPKELEIAVGTALGGAQQNLVSRTGQDAKYIIDTLRRNDFGRCTILPLDLLNENTVKDKDRHFVEERGVLGLACELIQWEPGIDKAVEYLLGRTLVVENLSVGVDLKVRSGGTFQIVTLKGDLITPGGAMTGGSTQKKNFSLLGREREISELKEQYKLSEQKRTESEENATLLKQQVAQSAIQVDGLIMALHDKDIELEKHNEHLSIIDRDIQTAINARESIEEQRALDEENLRSIRERMEQLSHEQSDMEAQDSISRQEVVEESKALYALRHRRDEQAEALTELRLRFTALEKEANAREAEKANLIKQMDRADEKIASDRVQMESIQSQLELAYKQREAVLQSVAGGKELLEQAQSEQKQLEEQRLAQSEELRLRRTRREELLAQSRDLFDQRTRTEMALGKLQTSLEQQQDKIWQNYGLTYENALALKEEIPITSSSQRAAKLRETIRSLGSVNVDSIEEYEHVSSRYEALNTQYEDLDKAAKDLHVLIDKLTHTMEKVFATEFERVQTEFKQVFVALFGGGQAELRLGDPKDVLNCDIDIIAQPPGKKLQLLSLMSGGERALTAIALLFAMLRVKSPVFCFPDEIETSLDEANVSRFAEFVRDYGQQTQFILITHRKGSMEVCNTLYGVAMEEKGVSSIVSAKFEEAT
ncbi:MAG: chromosome segregation protein SMC [Clostridia bacterium]|nr:chromosome segregation protein SMC [Clostridia bacterium]